MMKSETSIFDPFDLSEEDNDLPAEEKKEPHPSRDEQPPRRRGGDDGKPARPPPPVATAPPARQRQQGQLAPPSVPPPSSESTLNDDIAIEKSDSFDPFGIAALSQDLRSRTNDSQRSTESPYPPPQVSRITRTTARGNNNATTRQSLAALPPKLLVKLAVYEEVSSTAATTMTTTNALPSTATAAAATAESVAAYGEGSSDVTVEGSVYVQVQCSDALKNAPFLVRLRPPKFVPHKLQLRPNAKYSVMASPSTHDQSSGGLIVQVPKQDIGFVGPIAYYNWRENVPHMPVLLERKVTVHPTTRVCKVAVQLRSKLSNQSDLEHITIAVAMPELVDGSTVQIVRGGDNGHYDDLKRLITWTLPLLNKGESFMVSAQASLWRSSEEDNEDDDDDDGVRSHRSKQQRSSQLEASLKFPVLLRCSSAADQIGSIDVEAQQAEGYAVSLTTSTVTSFRLLHRLT